MEAPGENGVMKSVQPRLAEFGERADASPHEVSQQKQTTKKRRRSSLTGQTKPLSNLQDADDLHIDMIAERLPCILESRELMTSDIATPIPIRPTAPSATTTLETLYNELKTKRTVAPPLDLAVEGQDLTLPPRRLPTAPRQLKTVTAGHLPFSGQLYTDDGGPLQFNSAEEERAYEHKRIKSNLERVLRVQSLGVPLQISRGDYRPGHFAMPLFHCPRCLEHWTESGVIPDDCKQPYQPSKGPEFSLSAKTCRIVKYFSKVNRGEDGNVVCYPTPSRAPQFGPGGVSFPRDGTDVDGYLSDSLFSADDYLPGEDSDDYYSSEWDDSTDDDITPGRHRATRRPGTEHKLKSSKSRKHERREDPRGTGSAAGLGPERDSNNDQTERRGLKLPAINSGNRNLTEAGSSSPLPGEEGPGGNGGGRRRGRGGGRGGGRRPGEEHGDDSLSDEASDDRGRRGENIRGKENDRLSSQTTGRKKVRQKVKQPGREGGGSSGDSSGSSPSHSPDGAGGSEEGHRSSKRSHGRSRRKSVVNSETVSSNVDRSGKSGRRVDHSGRHQVDPTGKGSTTKADPAKKGSTGADPARRGSIKPDHTKQGSNGVDPTRKGSNGPDPAKRGSIVADPARRGSTKSDPQGGKRQTRAIPVAQMTDSSEAPQPSNAPSYQQSNQNMKGKLGGLRRGSVANTPSRRASVRERRPSLPGAPKKVSQGSDNVKHGKGKTDKTGGKKKGSKTDPLNKDGTNDVTRSHDADAIETSISRQDATDLGETGVNLGDDLPTGGNRRASIPQGRQIVKKTKQIISGKDRSSGGQGHNSRLLDNRKINQDFKPSSDGSGFIGGEGGGRRGSGWSEQAPDTTEFKDYRLKNMGSGVDIEKKDSGAGTGAGGTPSTGLPKLNYAQSTLPPPLPDIRTEIKTKISRKSLGKKSSSVLVSSTTTVRVKNRKKGGKGGTNSDSGEGSGGSEGSGSDPSSSGSSDPSSSEGESLEDIAKMKARLHLPDLNELSILSFTPAFTFSLFQLPEHYRAKNQMLKDALLAMGSGKTPKKGRKTFP